MSLTGQSTDQIIQMWLDCTDINQAHPQPMVSTKRLCLSLDQWNLLIQTEIKRHPRAKVELLSPFSKLFFIYSSIFWKNINFSKITSKHNTSPTETTQSTNPKQCAVKLDTQQTSNQDLTETIPYKAILMQYAARWDTVPAPPAQIFSTQKIIYIYKHIN